MPFLATSFQPEMSEVIDQCDLETLVDTVNKNLPEPPQMYPKIIREFAEDYEHEEVFG